MASPVWATDYHLYAAAGVKLPLIEFTKAFNQTHPGSYWTNHFDTAGAAEKQFFQEAQASCLITTDSRMREAKRTNKLTGMPIIPLVDTLAGIASSRNNKSPISTPDQFKRTLLEARSIAFSNPARGATVGLHFENVIRQLGIEKEVLSKATLASDGVETMQLVMAKKVDLGITQTSEIIQAWPESLLGAFPGEFELATRYSMWCKNPDNPEIAEFIHLIQTNWASRVFTRNGLRPVIKP